MNSLQDIINTFSPISLKEMDSVKLMNRTDTKFVFKLDQLELLLPKLREEYRILDTNGIRSSKYETLYYDTEDYNLYINHQNNKLNRFKIRVRNYVESNLVYFEVKFKNNKGRTIKNRVKRQNLNSEFSQREMNLLTELSSIDPKKLAPKIWVNYSRTTLVAINSCERVTIDTNLHFINGQITKGYNDLVILEVKQERAKNSPIITLLKDNFIREGSLSKYCLGIASTVSGIKMNNFKKNLRTINKLLYATSVS